MNKWFPEALNEFKIVSVFDLLMEYINEGRIELDPGKHDLRATYHDPCNYGRKSMKAFGVAYYEEGRIITKKCTTDYQEMEPNRESNYCCGGGGGAWAMPFAPDRVFFGRIKARQIQETGAELVIAPCHNCRDQMMKSLNQEYDLGIEVKYLWELVADSLVLPGEKQEEIETEEAGE